MRYSPKHIKSKQIWVEIIKPEKAMSACKPRSSKAPLSLWHCCLGHISEETIQNMAKEGVITGMEVEGPGSGNCSTCLKGKQTWSNIPHVTEEQSTKVLSRVFSDLCGPMETLTTEGHHYFITFTNDYSHYTHIGFCKHKDDTLTMFKIFKACAEKETGKSLKILCTDGGGEYSSNAFNSFLAKNGIKQETTNPYTPQENGVSKC